MTPAEFNSRLLYLSKKFGIQKLIDSLPVRDRDFLISVSSIGLSHKIAVEVMCEIKGGDRHPELKKRLDALADSLVELIAETHFRSLVTTLIFRQVFNDPDWPHPSVSEQEL